MSESFVYPANLLQHHRSQFPFSETLKTTYMHGDCVPYKVIPCLPGDTWKEIFAAMIRMSSPIAPIMDDITQHVAAYWCPLRILDEGWEETVGVNKTGAWTTGMSDVVVPHIQTGRDELTLAEDFVPGARDSFTNSDHGTISNWDYMTLGTYIYNTNPMAITHSGVSDNLHLPEYLKLSLLPPRAYYLVWNYFYRSSVVSAPIAVDRSVNNDVIVGENPIITLFRKPEPLGQYPTLFNKCLPQPQFGDAVQFIQDLIPVKAVSADMAGVQSPLRLVNVATGDNLTGNIYMSAADGVAKSSTTGASLGSVNFGFENLAADFSNSLKTINDLRYATQLQKFLEKDARYGGSKSYRDMINAHYGVSISEGLVQQPQFIGEFNFKINVDQVLSTAGYSASSSSTVGAPGANSTTCVKQPLFTFSAPEFGYIIIVGGARHNITYAGAIPKYLTHLDKLSFYWPEFNNIGEVPVYGYETGDLTDEGANVYGYQEAWYEYRHGVSTVNALVDPRVPGSLSFWSLARDYGGSALAELYVYEGRSAIANALVTGETGPDYIMDARFVGKASRCMELFSIPGFMDHH